LAASAAGCGASGVPPRIKECMREAQVMKSHDRFGSTITKAALMVFAAIALATNTGCLIPMYSGDPVRRAEQLIYTSEDLRQITDEWERIWFLDQPSHMTLYRTHGGVL
jgi:ABC-type dipeptide/oligopeptide/nickel transport system permease component